MQVEDLGGGGAEAGVAHSEEAAIKAATEISAGHPGRAFGNHMHCAILVLLQDTACAVQGKGLEPLPGGRTDELDILPPGFYPDGLPLDPIFDFEAWQQPAVVDLPSERWASSVRQP